MLDASVENPIDRWQVILSTSLLSGAGALMFGAFPVFLAAAAEKLALKEDQVGYLPSAFYLGYMVLSVSTVFWVRKINWKLTGGLGALVAALPLAAMIEIRSYQLMLVLMVVSGAGMGILYALATAILSDSSNPDRVFGIKLAVETMPGTALLFLLPLLVIPYWGFNGAALVMALCAGAAMLCTIWVPAGHSRYPALDYSGTTVSTDDRDAISPLLVWLALVATLLYFIAIVSPWVFMQLMGENIGLEGETIGAVLSAGLFIAILGGFVAALVGTRFGHITPMLMIMGILFVSIFLLASGTTLLSFAAGCLLLLSTMNLALSYLLGLTARVDTRGDLIVLSTAVLAAAVIIGPAIGGNLVGDGDFTLLLWFSAACGVGSLGLYCFVALRANVDKEG